MARKPPPGLPDVFASPGGAPSRGAAIEDLPDTTPAPAEPPPEPPAPAPAAHAPMHAEPVAQPPGPAVPSSPEGGLRQHAFALAAVALVVSLTAPFWQAAVLSALGIRTSAEQIAQQSARAVQQEQQQVDELSRQFSAATEQINRQQTALAASLQRVGQAATLVRSMALVRLSDALRQAAPFAAELAMVRVSNADTRELKPQLDRVGPYASIGIPSATQLRQEFRALYDQLHTTNGSGGSWVGNLAFWNTAPQPASDPAVQQLQAAASHAASGDLPGTLVSMRPLGDAYQTYFANWLEDANARIAADSIIEQITNSVNTSLR